MKNSNKQTVGAFTLIELSVVLVIISTIISGILVGRALIHSAELQAVVAGINKYMVAYDQFRLKYDAFPGDMRDAEDYWPGRTANGDGDTRIRQGVYYGLPQNEAAYTFNQLSLAGVLDGSFSSYLGFSTDENMPAGSISGSNFVMVMQSYLYEFRDVNLIIYQGPFYSSGMHGIGALSPKDAKSIDKKMDNGVAYTGNLVTINAFALSHTDSTACIDASVTTTPANYNLSVTNTTCRLMYLLE